jgi:hypothetical protein
MRLCKPACDCLLAPLDLSADASAFHRPPSCARARASDLFRYAF